MVAALLLKIVPVSYYKASSGMSLKVMKSTPSWHLGSVKMRQELARSL